MQEISFLPNFFFEEGKLFEDSTWEKEKIVFAMYEDEEKGNFYNAMNQTWMKSIYRQASNGDMHDSLPKIIYKVGNMK